MDWSVFRIGETVTPMPHISEAVRDCPTPGNRTDIRNFIVLEQQISYAMAVAPKLIPFRELLKETTPWDWTDEIDNVFRETMTGPANNVEEGIRLFDPSRVTE